MVMAEEPSARPFVSKSLPVMNINYEQNKPRNYLKTGGLLLQEIENWPKGITRSQLPSKIHLIGSFQVPNSKRQTDKPLQ